MKTCEDSFSSHSGNMPVHARTKIMIEPRTSKWDNKTTSRTNRRNSSKKHIIIDKQTNKHTSHKAIRIRPTLLRFPTFCHDVPQDALSQLGTLKPNSWHPGRRGSRKRRAWNLSKWSRVQQGSRFFFKGKINYSRIFKGSTSTSLFEIS